jgi:hypothetical protein
MFEKFELSDDIHFPTSRRKVTQKISGALWEFINVSNKRLINGRNSFKSTDDFKKDTILSARELS